MRTTFSQSLNLSISRDESHRLTRPVRALLAAVVVLLLGTATLAKAATFTEAAPQLNLNLNTASEAVAIVSNGTSYTLTLTVGTWSGTDSVNVTGNGTVTLTVTAAGLGVFDTINLTDSATGSTATFNDSGANTYGDTFNVTLDEASAGTITFNGASSFTGSAGIAARASRNITVAFDSTLETVNGNILLEANQQATATSGSFDGVLINAATVEATGTGNVTVQGRGGNDGGGLQYGVTLQSGAVLSGGASGTLTVTGTGGATGGNQNIGVNVQETNTRITSSGGPVNVTGQGGGTGASNSNAGVVLLVAGQISAGGTGTVTVTGAGGATLGGINYGVYVDGANTQITSGGGTVSVTGTGTANSEALVVQLSGEITTAITSAPILLTGDNIDISSPGFITAGTGLVTLQPRTAGTLIDLGGADVLSGSPLTLGLTDAELDQVTASTLEIGNITSGPLTVSADIIRFGVATVVELISGSDVVLSGGQVNTSGGTLLLDPGLTPAAVKPIRAGTDIKADTVSFGSDLNINIVGPTVDTDYTQLNVAGIVDLKGVDLVLTGAFVPPAINDVFTIVSATSVTGTFNGLANGNSLTFNGRTLQIGYTRTAVTLTVTALPVELQSFEVE